MESYTAGGSDKVARVLLENLKADKIFLLVNKSIDERIIFKKNFNSKIHVVKYRLITPMDIGIYANKFNSRKYIYFILKFTDYLVRYPLLLISFFYFYFLMLRLNATHFFAHNGGYPGGLFCGTATIAAFFLPTIKYRFYAFHSMPFNLRKHLYLFDIIWDKLIDKSCKLISVSKASSKQLLKLRFFKQDPFCIYNGLQIRNLKKYNKTKLIRILHVGYFDIIKNQIMLIKSLNLLMLSGIQNIKLTFVGEVNDLVVKNEIDEYIKLNNLSKYISFKGFQKDVEHYYETNDVLVCTSKIESFPLAILEAMRVGMPIISTNVGGVNEQLQNGVNGYLVEEGDIQTLANKILIFYKNPDKIELMGKKSHDIFKKKFLIKKMINEYQFKLKL